VRVFAGNTADSDTVVDQIRILKERFGVEELVFVGDRGMVKSKGKQALQEAGLRYITALTDPQIRRLLREGALQMGLFSEEVCEVEADGVRYVLRKNESEAAREEHRLADKLAKLAKKVQQRNQQVQTSPRCRPQAGLHWLQPWVARHKLTGLVGLRLEGREMVLENNEAAMERALELAGCYVVVTDVPPEGMSGQAVHDGSAADVCAQREAHPRACVLLHAGAEANASTGAAAPGRLRHHGHGSAHRYAAQCAGLVE
jgi:hypothetical protein